MSSAGWLRHDPVAKTVRLTLHVQPNARRSEAAGLHGDALKVRVAAPAVDDKANAALREFLGDVLGTPLARIAIRHGAHGRRKVIEVSGVDPVMLEKIAALAAD